MEQNDLDYYELTTSYGLLEKESDVKTWCIVGGTIGGVVLGVIGGILIGAFCFK